MRRIFSGTRSKSPQTQRAKTGKPRAPLNTTAKKAPPPLAVSKPENQSHLEPSISSRSSEELKKLNNAASSSTAENAAQHDRDMKSATAKNHVSVGKANREQERKKPLTPVSMNASIQKPLMIGTPSKAAHAFYEYKDGLTQEYADAAQLLKMASKLGNEMIVDHNRFFTEGRDFIAKVQAYRLKTGDTKIDSTPPTAEQFAACEAELKLNDKEYQRYAYYLNHRNNKDYAMHERMKSDFVEYGVLSDLIPKDKRPPADEIYSAQLIIEIKAPSKKEGTHVIVTAEIFLSFPYKTGFLGRPTPSPDYLHGDGEMFNTETEAIQEIHRIAGPNPSDASLTDAAQKVLGLTYFKGQILIDVWIPPKAIRNERPPSGKEHGANNKWLMGGTTPYGHYELITDRVNMAGIPGTDPNETAPTVRILGERGKGIAVYPDNYLNIGNTVIKMLEADAQKELHKKL